MIVSSAIASLNRYAMMINADVIVDDAFMMFLIDMDCLFLMNNVCFWLIWLE